MSIDWKYKQANATSKTLTVKRPTVALVNSGVLKHDARWYTNHAWMLCHYIFATPPRGSKTVEMAPLPSRAYDLLRSAERDCAVPLKLTSVLSHDNDGKKFYQRLERETGTPVWLDRMYVAWLEELDDLEWFAGRTHYDPVRLVRDSVTLGVIMPIKADSCETVCPPHTEVQAYEQGFVSGRYDDRGLHAAQKDFTPTSASLVAAFVNGWTKTGGIRRGNY